MLLYHRHLMDWINFSTSESVSFAVHSPLVTHLTATPWVAAAVLGGALIRCGRSGARRIPPLTPAFYARRRGAEAVCHIGAAAARVAAGLLAAAGLLPRNPAPCLLCTTPADTCHPCDIALAGRQPAALLLRPHAARMGVSAWQAAAPAGPCPAAQRPATLYPPRQFVVAAACVHRRRRRASHGSPPC